ncbi:type I restriction-modification system endonuclease [Elizabethkingia anophelis]|uniref:Type I restriction-modification system endonuclease n=1 Tax=Elizabethkingia anophelis TaxID=1117645 RepID=A0AAU8VGD3_9FLAO|nr:type I restriction-modification system endonuclease [Elizabethkingia anophelis]AQX02180.1 type I restriction-modification system endonuclease [Elizabethkingia anophelis]MYY49254.1 type I restriction-modification system endonuclease [Elizabethkingia anophelis]OPB63928.1 type I restriction-modification system endonuclease [Elizabethkingia anophelis]
MDSKFYFLQDLYPELFNCARLAETLYYIDASSSISKSRLFCEKLAGLIAGFESEDISHLSQYEAIQYLNQHEILPDTIADIFHTVRKYGNRASHIGSHKSDDALSVLKKIFSLGKWFFETYDNDIIEDLSYELPPNKSEQEITSLTGKVDELTIQLKNYELKIQSLNASENDIKQRREKAQFYADKISLNEYDTRIQLIDVQLRAAGWECDTENINYKNKKTLPEKGKNKAIAEWPCGTKYADYALFIGTELYGLVEAKKYNTDISTNLRQSKVYSENILPQDEIVLLGQWDTYKVPFLYSTNGKKYLEQLKTKSGIWFQDIRKSTNRPYALKGWYSPEGLKELYNRDLDTASEKLLESDYDYLTSPSGLNLRDYQIEAIQSVENKITEFPFDKRALLVMATGTGKTRTINGLIYRLIKANRFKRILFLTDRKLLATQARDSIKENKVEAQQSFGGIYHFDDLGTTIPDSESRLHFATVQSMVKRLFYNEGEPLTVDAYDCIIVDEAHRGYQLDKEMNEDDFGIRNEDDYVAQYRKVLDYFDAFKIGMTATPALHTTEIFGESVYNYSYRKAVIDGNLVDHEPPYNIATILNTEGIAWEKGEKPQVYDAETGEITDLDELEDELKFDVEHFNKQVLNDNFNRVVVQELVKSLDPEGNEKTIIFAARDSHADTIINMLGEEFEKIGVDVHEKAIQKITGSVYDNAQLTRDFKNERYPNIVVTVDLLTTGIDVPSICNVVFMRRVRSRILYEQMMGRATRLCPEIGKESFKIFDAVRLYEALKDYTQIQTVGNPSYTFQQLVEETQRISDEQRLYKQIEQIIAKLQRKSRNLTDENKEHISYHTNGDSIEGLIQSLKNTTGSDIKNTVEQLSSLWNYLDTKVYKKYSQFVSTHVDAVREVSRGYGNAEKPEDYIDGFKKFLQENINTIAAINIICNKPQELDRKSLRELKLLLDEKGFNETSLNTAWKSTKNVEIAADIIAYIRTLSMGIDLITPQERVQRAIGKLKSKYQWNAVQLKWIDRFEKQLMAETVLTKQDLDLKPFLNEGGFNRLNKIFNNELEELITELNSELYSA